MLLSETELSYFLNRLYFLEVKSFGQQLLSYPGINGFNTLRLTFTKKGILINLFEKHDSSYLFLMCVDVKSPQK